VDTAVLKDGIGGQISLDDAEVSVGRDAENLVSLHAQGVSRYHARVFCENGTWTVEDLGSTNGTRINNSKLEKKQSLKNGDTVAFGRACYKFQLVEVEDAGAAAGMDIDLGAGDKTMMMRPGTRPAHLSAAADTAKAPAPASAARTAATTKPAAAKSSGSSNAVLWIIVILAFAALVIGGAKLLGVF